MTDHKRRVQAALEKFAAKDLKEIDKIQGKGRKNASPEKDLVATPCMAWMRQQGWSVDIFESKSTYDPRRGVYRQQSMKAGISDCLGTLPDGIQIIIEFKAPGRLSTFNKDGNHRQREFVIEKIRLNAFACVVDSLEMLQKIYFNWEAIRYQDKAKARAYLTESLPK